MSSIMKKTNSDTSDYVTARGACCMFLFLKDLLCKLSPPYTAWYSYCSNVYIATMFVLFITRNFKMLWMLVFNDTRVMIIFVMSFITVGSLPQNLIVKAYMPTDTVLHCSYKIIIYKPTVCDFRLLPQSR